MLEWGVFTVDTPPHKKAFRTKKRKKHSDSWSLVALLNYFRPSVEIYTSLILLVTFYQQFLKPGADNVRRTANKERKGTASECEICSALGETIRPATRRMHATFSARWLRLLVQHRHEIRFKLPERTGELCVHPFN